ncbi:tRNA (adenosine(37)-N6)-threonylcarbamoyltransferase complex ATPase subunit type 1 TsaE [bacterium]|jgi:tRNA threonylcarbamoyladenosine biosynthesis protein TsaE|nr:tRNA (adenosine(37)-N6)-threonylcarbamoyltransferase complex ATPase subunit type 1 TsaE [bacterium]
MIKHTYHLSGLSDLDQFSLELLPHLSDGSVILLTGELGAGKTTFVSSLAKTLGITDPVSSPTFALIQTYEGGKGPLHHMDLYRLRSETDCASLDLDRYLPPKKGITCIEWPDRLGSLLPENVIQIHLEYSDAPTARDLKLTLPD